MQRNQPAVRYFHVGNIYLTGGWKDSLLNDDLLCTIQLLWACRQMHCNVWYILFRQQLIQFVVLFEMLVELKTVDRTVKWQILYTRLTFKHIYSICTPCILMWAIVLSPSPIPLEAWQKKYPALVGFTFRIWSEPFWRMVNLSLSPIPIVAGSLFLLSEFTEKYDKLL